MYLDSFIKLGYGSYKELVELTVRDLVELEIIIKSKQDEEKISKVL